MKRSRVGCEICCIQSKVDLHMSVFPGQGQGTGLAKARAGAGDDTHPPRQVRDMFKLKVLAHGRK